MPRWMKPSEEQPDIDCGDRIVIIVAERKTEKSRLRSLLVILEATDGGWKSPDPDFGGYSLEDGILWAHEDSVCEIAKVIFSEVFQ